MRFRFFTATVTPRNIPRPEFWRISFFFSFLPPFFPRPGPSRKEFQVGRMPTMLLLSFFSLSRRGSRFFPFFSTQLTIFLHEQSGVRDLPRDCLSPFFPLFSVRFLLSSRANSFLFLFQRRLAGRSCSSRVHPPFSFSLAGSSIRVAQEFFQARLSFVCAFRPPSCVPPFRRKLFSLG